MKSPLHKVLHTVCGRAIIDYILDTLDGLCDEKSSSS
jgi:bifunctional N-acetylglucosamine-1-phosphate-uridyltransferase/glucosamine-1-phosphate-acetyltransferase GlmU-like protein